MNVYISLEISCTLVKMFKYSVALPDALFLKLSVVELKSLPLIPLRLTSFLSRRSKTWEGWLYKSNLTRLIITRFIGTTKQVQCLQKQ